MLFKGFKITSTISSSTLLVSVVRKLNNYFNSKKSDNRKEKRQGCHFLNNF